MEQLQYHQQIEFGKTSKSDGELGMKREVGSDFSVLRNGIRERKGFDVMMEGRRLFASWSGGRWNELDGTSDDVDVE